MNHHRFQKLLTTSLEEHEINNSPIGNLHEGLGLISATFHQLLSEIQKSQDEQDPEILLEALIELAAASGRVASDVVLPACGSDEEGGY